MTDRGDKVVAVEDEMEWHEIVLYYKMNTPVLSINFIL